MNFYPTYTDRATFDSLDIPGLKVFGPAAWYITTGDISDPIFWTTQESKDILHFRRERDCQIACESLNKLNMIYEDFVNLTDQQLLKIICENLQW